MEQEYIILEGDGDSFTNRLASPLNFGNDSVQVALMQIQILLTWANITQDHQYFGLLLPNEEQHHLPKKERTRIYFIEPGRYSFIHDVIRAIKEAIPAEQREYLEININDRTQKCEVNLKQNAALTFHSDFLLGYKSFLGELLGFKLRPYITGSA